MKNTLYIKHDFPIWKEKADFIIQAILPKEDWSDKNIPEWEELRVKKITDDTFEVCCVPFFLYDVVLGDIIKTKSVNGEDYFYDKVIQTSNRYGFRVNLNNKKDHIEIHKELNDLGCIIEPMMESFFAIDVKNKKHAKEISNYLQTLEDNNIITYETIRTKHI